ncbi:MAG: hypothetical protein IJ996_04155 [Clostridia bacterium]|nr:hypothetical protein [Clostridia bacterium]
MKQIIDQQTQADLKDTLIQDAQAFYQEKEESSRYMFGYPSYRYPLSARTQYLLSLHYRAPFANNCGDIEERGNYAMDTKDMEKRIVGLYAEKFGMGDNFWGYVTSGGSESNSCGIVLAFLKNPNGILYYSQSAHYSVEKYAKVYRHVEIPTTANDKLNLDVLFQQIKANYQKDGSPANLVLTHGTTKYGECDDVDAVVRFLKSENIPYYIHVDAALFGGIPNSQKDAPLLLNAKQRGIHSVSVSLHKYVGFPDVKSVFVATHKPMGQKIAYIGQTDTTVSGSRSIPAYALYNHVQEQLREENDGLYAENIRLFASLLEKNGVPYYRAPLSNIFVVDEASKEVCKHFQLSCFDAMENGQSKRKAHVIIFPSHREKEMQELAESLQKDTAKR